MIKFTLKKFTKQNKLENKSWEAGYIIVNIKVKNEKKVELPYYNSNAKEIINLRDIWRI